MFVYFCRLYIEQECRIEKNCLLIVIRIKLFGSFTKTNLPTRKKERKNKPNIRNRDTKNLNEKKPCLLFEFDDQAILVDTLTDTSMKKNLQTKTNENPRQKKLLWINI